MLYEWSHLFIVEDIIMLQYRKSNYSSGYSCWSFILLFVVFIH